MRTATPAATEARPEAGLSLVEVMVAMAVFVIGSLSLLTVLSSSTGGTFDNRARVTAANLAASDIDDARSRTYADLSPGTTTRTVEVDGRVYEVRRQVGITWASGTSATSSCVASASARQIHKRVSTSVTTDWRGQQKAVRADTIVKAPVFDPASSNGAIGFLVMNRSGQPLPGLPVSVPGRSSTTDADGCAFLEELAPGPYTVTVVRPGSVTRLGSTPLTKGVTVLKGQITSESMRVDVGISVTVKARAFVGADAAPAPYWGATWRTPTQHRVDGGPLLPTSVRLTSPDRATSTALTLVERKVLTGSDLVWTSSVYPSPAGYEAHTGGCTAPSSHLDTEPSTSPSVDLPYSPLTVQLKGGGDHAKSKSITATWITDSCSEVLTWSATTGGGCQGTADLNGNSCRLDLALPAGRWLLRVSAADGGSTTATGSVPVNVVARTAQPSLDLPVSGP